MNPKISWLGHASFKITGSKTIYIDPWRIEGAPHDADIILISHNHYDHFSVFDIERIEHARTLIFGPRSVIEELKRGNPFRPWDRAAGGTTEILGTPAYNPKSPFHPKSKMWLGFIISMDGSLIYFTGDTDLVPEMEELPADITLILVPVSGIHAMNPKLAIKVCDLIKAKYVIPYQWGDRIGTSEDVDYFCDYVKSSKAIKILPGNSFNL